MQALIDSGVAVSFVGSTTGLEQQYLTGIDVDFHGIACGKLRRYFSWQNLADVFRVVRGLWQSFWLLGRVRPDVVFSKGGFVSFPVVLAAWLRRIPIVAHESDFSPGLANRLAMPFVDVLCTSFASDRPSRLRGDMRYTGSPVRAELLNGSRERGRARQGYTTLSTRRYGGKKNPGRSGAALLGHGLRLSYWTRWIGG